MVSKGASFETPFFHGAGMKIRTVRDSDIEAITAIYGRSVREETSSFELKPPSVSEMKTQMKTLVGQGYPYLVAQSSSGEVLGYAYASPHRPRPAYAHTVENTVYVAKEAWRSGVGCSLLTSLIEHCIGKGYRQMIGVVACEPGVTTSPSIRLHQVLGFEIAGRLEAVGYKHDCWLDVVLMQRALSNGQSTE